MGAVFAASWLISGGVLSESESVEARLSSTVLVLGDRPDASAEVLMAQRPGHASFMGGTYVFPGGAVDLEDGSPQLLARCTGLTGPQAVARLGVGHNLTPLEALSVHVAALRETFEEVGLLLARGPRDRPLSLDQAKDAQRFDKHRADLRAGRLAFVDILESEGLTLDLATLIPWAHWITPLARPKRFDTYFFLARRPASQLATDARGELEGCRWIPPHEALHANQRGAFPLPPPTFCVLEEIALLRGVPEILAATAGRRLRPVLPRAEKREGVLTILLPGDRDYPAPPGMGVEGATRLRLEAGGGWHSDLRI